MNHRTRVRPRPGRASSPSAAQTAAIIATAGLDLLAAACGPTAAPRGAQAGATSTGRSAYTQALAFANCMRAHGVPSWPDPNSFGGFDKSKVAPPQLRVGASQAQSADRACTHLLPNGLGGRPTQAGVQQIRAQALRFAQCMRDHHIAAFPDPDSNGGLRIPDSV